MALGCYLSEKGDTDLFNVTQVVLISHDFVEDFFYYYWPHGPSMNIPNLEIAY